jgi:hypothetical protein
LAGIYELQEAWERALAARPPTAEAFAEQDLDIEAAAERLAAALHLQSAASFTGPLELVAGAGPAGDPARTTR